AGNPLRVVLRSGFTAAVTPDNTQLTLLATVPASAAGGVSLFPYTTLFRSEAMDASTINTTTFILKQGTTPVAGTVSYSGVTATFTHAHTLEPRPTSTAKVSTGTKNIAGNALASDMICSFTTGVLTDATAPT